MTRIFQAEARNLLLSRLSGKDFELLAPHLQRVTHNVGGVVARSGTALDQACFPEGGVCALLIPMCDGRSLAVGLIGLEGVIGVSALHGAQNWRHDVIARAVPATALRIDADRLLQACQHSETLRDSMLRYSGYLMLQVSRATVTNLVEPLERRMARWILLYHDRVAGDDVPITHQEIGIMLGVRRASATDILHVLEGLGAIRSTRGLVVVRDRAALEKIAGETYGDAEADYRRLIGPFGKAAMSSRPTGSEQTLISATTAGGRSAAQPSS